jgi:hypothetical protein
MTALTIATKACTKCAEVKPLSGFHRNRRSPDGRQNRCKECMRSEALESQARRRAEMGEDAWLAYKRDNVRRSRQNPDVRRRQLLAQAAYSQALQALRRLHSSEFDALHARERYERGLDPPTAEAPR